MTITDLAPPKPAPKPAPPTEPKLPAEPPSTVLLTAALLAGFTAAAGVVGLHLGYPEARRAFAATGLAVLVAALRLAGEWRAGRGWLRGEYVDPPDTGDRR